MFTKLQYEYVVNNIDSGLLNICITNASMVNNVVCLFYLSIWNNSSSFKGLFPAAAVAGEAESRFR